MKRAMKWYAQEKNKPGELSSYQIAEKVKKEYDGVGPHSATIRRYVNAHDSRERIGAALLIRKCLGDPQVRQSIDIDKEYALLINYVQEANEYAIYSLLLSPPAKTVKISTTNKNANPTQIFVYQSILPPISSNKLAKESNTTMDEVGRWN